MGLSRKFANLGKALDSGASGDFLTVGDSGGVFRDVEWTEIANKPSYVDSAAATALIDSAYVQARQTDIGLDSGMITNLVDSAYVQLRQGEIGLDSAQVISIIDSAYVSARTPAALDSGGVTGLIDSNYVTNRVTANSGFKNYRYTATADQTTFDSTDVNGNTLSFSEDGILVFYNGVVLEKTVDYTTSTNSITLTEPADSGVSVNIATWTLSTSSSAASGGWYGDRALATGGTEGADDRIEYWNMTTAGNAADFGDRSVTGIRFVASATGGGSRSFFAGGLIGYGGDQVRTNNIEYVTTTTLGNGTDFGDLTLSRNSAAGLSDGTYGVIAGGATSSGSYSNVMDYITVATTGDATDFGDLLAAGSSAGSWNDATRGVIGGKFGGSSSNVIEYITIASTGNSTDFGDLSVTRHTYDGSGDTTRALWGGGYSSTLAANQDVIDYVTIQTTGNATDFGDLTVAKRSLAMAGNGTVVHFAGGYPDTNVIEEVTVQTTGNATDFGDLTGDFREPSGCSGAAA